MPVRIYDLAKKLGLESKEVLAKAKELGITSAKVPSSSLDKITAEYLEEQLAPRAVAKPPEAPAVSAAAEATSVAPPEVIPGAKVITPTTETVSGGAIVELPPTPPVPEVPPPASVVPPASVTPEIPPAIQEPELAPAPPAEVTAPSLEIVSPPVDAKTPPAEVTPPAPVQPPTPPPGPQVGEKIGFIQLPQK